ncbi:MAG: rhodanese-like domain-containing protein [Acidimicrobiales bacterium]|jgi:thiosulfate/3-mercaptopyruvate sulfurtransferase
MPGSDLLIDAPSLRDELGEANLRVIDATAFLVREVPGGPYTVQSGRAGFDDVHIEGAVFADIPADLSDPESPFRFAVPRPEGFARAIGALGVGPGVRVVVYARETPMWATRLWWLLRYFGFDDVRVLDGGLPAWLRAGYPVSREPSVVAPATFVARPRPELLASKNDVLRYVGGEPACLVNALLPEAFRGEGPGAYSRPGRIPGSLSVPAHDLTDADTGCFRPAAELAHELGHLVNLDRRVPLVVYCGGGISATVDIFVFSMLGRDDVRLYDGSLTEWSADPHLPLEVG